MMLTADSDLYGSLPMFPCLDYAPITEDRIERAVERLVDCADAQFMAGKATQAQYDAWSRQLSAWATLQVTKIGAPMPSKTFNPPAQA